MPTSPRWNLQTKPGHPDLSSAEWAAMIDNHPHLESRTPQTVPNPFNPDQELLINIHYNAAANIVVEDKPVAIIEWNKGNLGFLRVTLGDCHRDTLRPILEEIASSLNTMVWEDDPLPEINLTADYAGTPLPNFIKVGGEPESSFLADPPVCCRIAMTFIMRIDSPSDTIQSEHPELAAFQIGDMGSLSVYQCKDCAEYKIHWQSA